MTIKLTKEEAIQDLEAIKSFERYARGRLALDIAIEALKGAEINCVHCPRYFETEDETGVHSHCEDLISRAEAAEVFEAMLKTATDPKIKIGISRSWQQIKDLPSADRPKGEWIHTPNGIDRDFVWWTCSECGHKIFSETEKDRIEFHAYCGRCGAYMRGDTERC